MSINVVCKCGAKFAARDQLAGKDIECVACGGTLHVPLASPEGMSARPGKAVAVTLVAMGAALLGCGAMLYLLQSRIQDLEGNLKSSTATSQARSDEMRRELEKTNQNAAEQSQQEKERFAAVQQELEAEAKKRQSLADSMDKLDMDTVRIRGDIDRVERERREALAETQAKRAASERQLADLRAELGKKASEQETTRIKADIARVEQGNEELTREAAANQAKVAAYDRQIADLENQLRGKIKEQGQIRAQLATAETTLATLQKETLRLNAADLPKQIDDMKQQLDVGRSPRYQTVVVETTGGGQGSFLVDTATGQTTLSDASAGAPAPWPIPILESGALPNVGRKPGRFDVRTTYHNGDVRDVLRLDTESGDVWRCDISTGSPLWVPMPVWARRAPPGLSRSWSMSVSPLGSAGASSHPVIVLTRSDGTVLDNALLGYAFLQRMP